MNINRSNKRKWFLIKKDKKQTISCRNNDTNYTDDLAILANTSVQAKFLLHNLDQAARDIGLYVNIDKSWEDKGVHTFPKGICPKVNIIVQLEFKFMCFNFADYRSNHYTTGIPLCRDLCHCCQLTMVKWYM